ncbi:MAG: hypothetical protein AB7T31_16095 [Gemmatimonadales bacterium]
MRLSAVATLVLALVLGGCASSGPASQPQVDPFSARGAGSEDVLLTVQNNDFRDASIYALWNGVRRRVGSVTGMTSETFRMEWRSEEIQLAIDFVGGGDYVSERVPVTQGDHLDFVIMGR